MKFAVTPELTRLIYQIRRGNKITCKSVSAAINKSPSYVSKFENGEIASIDEDELISIFKNITNMNDFYNDILPLINSKYKEMFGMEKFENQLWLLNYDIVKRPITLPEQMIDEINLELNRTGTSYSQLADLINSNKDAPIADSVPRNELILYDLLEQTQLLLIWVKITEEDLKKLLTKQNRTTFYYVINAISYCMIRQKQFGNKDLTEENARQLLYLTCSYLKQYGISSCTSYTELLIKQNDIGKHENIITSIRSSNTEIMNQINDLLSAAADVDLLVTTKNMEMFRKNLQWDQGFMFKLMCMSYYELDPISFNLKQQFLNELEKLLQKYKNIPLSQRTFEAYK